MKENKMKQKLEQGKVCYGPFVKSIGPGRIGIVGYSGFDFVIIDL